jgi:beta-galactosidase/beta-glucuronidase
MQPVWILVLVSLVAASHYPYYPDRVTHDLSGEWDFVFAYDFDLNNTVLPAFNSTQAVPGAFDSRYGTGLQYARGTGFYRRSITITRGNNAKLHFEACSMWCRIYIDGKEISEVGHGGYTPFWVNVPPSNTSATRELVVIADNRFDPKRTPTHYVYYDFYQYGGLIRAVTLHELPTSSSFIQRLEAYPLSTAAAQPNGSVLLKIAVGEQHSTSDDEPPLLKFAHTTGTAKATKRGKKLTFTYSWDGHSHTDGQFTVTAPTGAKDVFVFEKQLEVLDPRIWSPAHPQLHTLTLRLLQSSIEPAVPAASAPVVSGGPAAPATPFGITGDDSNGVDYSHGDSAGDGGRNDEGGVAAAETIGGIALDLVAATDDISNVVDSIQIRFGLRTVGTSSSGRAVTINGAPVKLKGFNRHDMYPQYGPSLPVAVYKQDIQVSGLQVQ